MSASDVNFLILATAAFFGIWALMLYGIVIRHGGASRALLLMVIAFVLFCTWYLRAH